MSQRVYPLFASGIALFLMLFATIQTSRAFTDPFPPLSDSLSTPLVQLSDFTGIALGSRRLAADLAWIQTLQYYGNLEAGQSDSDFDNGKGRYPLLLGYCKRVAQIDPYFKYVYYYGAAALGWNLDRLPEAEQLLRQGIAANPKEWRFQQYLGGLAFQKDHDVAKLARFLDSFVEQPDCPNLVRSILANLYKKQGDYNKAIRVWMNVLQTNDEGYRLRAESEIHKMLDLGALKHQKGYLLPNSPIDK